MANPARPRSEGPSPGLSRAVPLLLVLSLAACATWSKHGIAPHPPRKIRVAVLPVQVAVTIKHLRNIETVPKDGAVPPNEKELIREEMSRAADDITRSIETDLGASYFFEVVPDSDVRRALEAAGLGASVAEPTAAQFKDLGRASGAQVLLVTKLSGYGAIKKRWLFYLIGTGLVEGGVQGAVAAAVISSPWAAVGIGVEEAAQEAVEWGGGAYLFGKFYAPVILESRMVSAADGVVVWSGTSLESSNSKALKALPADERKKREVRLRLTAWKAAENLTKKIDKNAWSNVKDADAAP